MLDIFKSDAFSFTSLTDAINRLPHVPTRLGKMGLFATQGITTLSAAIEMKDGVLTLVPSAARGAPGVNKTGQKATVRDFRTIHLPQVVHVLADEVQGVRAFGSESETQTIQALTNEKLAVARLDLDVTAEWQRVGCLKGEILDANGTTVIYNYFTEFGVSQQVIDMNLDNDATKVRGKCTAVARAVEDALGGVMMDYIHILAGDAFFDAFVDHPSVRDTFNATGSASVNREDLRRGFVFNNEVVVENYRGKIGSTAFIGTDDAYAIPVGVPRLFKTFYSPANYSETVNTLGLPYYAKPELMDFDKGVSIEVQSNPLHICTRPNAIVKLTRT